MASWDIRVRQVWSVNHICIINSHQYPWNGMTEYINLPRIIFYITDNIYKDIWRSIMHLNSHLLRVVWCRCSMQNRPGHEKLSRHRQVATQNKFSSCCMLRDNLSVITRPDLTYVSFLHGTPELHYFCWKRMMKTVWFNAAELMWLLGYTDAHRIYQNPWSVMWRKLKITTNLCSKCFW